MAAEERENKQPGESASIREDTDSVLGQEPNTDLKAMDRQMKPLGKHHSVKLLPSEREQMFN